MQLTGDRFHLGGSAGNDLATQPKLPCRFGHRGHVAPEVVFQIQIADYDILTAGDRPDVLVASEPGSVEGQYRRPTAWRNGDRELDEFTKRNLTKVGYVTTR